MEENKKSKIKKIKFLNGVPRFDDYEKQLLDRLKEEQGWEVEDVIRKEQETGEAMLLGEFKMLYRITNEVRELTSETDLSLEELRALHIDLLEKKRTIKIPLNKIGTDVPGGFVHLIEVTYEDGSIYIVNEDIRRMIVEKYNGAVSFLDDSIEAVQTRINYLEKMPPNESGKKVAFLTSPRHRLLLLYELGVLQYLKNEYPEFTESKFGDLLSLMLNKESETFRKESTNILNNTKTSKGEEIITEEAVNKVKGSLQFLGIKTKRLPDFD